MTADQSSQLARLLFGSSSRQRRQLQRTALASTVCVLLLILHIFEVRAGLMAQNQALWLTAFCLSGIIGFYFVLRTGLHLRISPRSTLTLPQQLFAIVTMVWTYAIVGPDRTAVIGLLVLILMFGVFAFRPREMIGLVILTLAMLAAVMFWQHQINPIAYPASTSAFQLCYATLAVGPVYILSSQIDGLQHSLATKKKALEQANEQIRRLAESDDLTGLLNRRAMAHMMQSEIQVGRPKPQNICIALIDIDLFKSVNDKFGHQAGDEVLRRFAAVGKSTIRSGDLFARWGGEEFLTMLQDTSVEQGIQCLERLRTVLAETSFDDISPGLRVTISTGITDFGSEDTLEMAIERADQAMYRAKQSGRDKVVLGRLHAKLAAGSQTPPR